MAACIWDGGPAAPGSSFCNDACTKAWVAYEKRLDMLDDMAADALYDREEDP